MTDLHTDNDPSTEVMKQVNRQFVTGVTVVTTMSDEEPRGLAVNAYASISLDPPMIMVCVQRTSSTYESLFASTHLGVNILSRDQADVVGVFASKAEDKFAGVDWAPGPYGSPLIERSSARLEAEIRERLQAKTHTVFICRVRHADANQRAPMVYGAGQLYDGAQLVHLQAP